MQIRQLAAACLVFLLLSTACASGREAPGDPATAVEDELSGSATVFAAASLTESFNEIVEVFKIQHPDAEIRFNFGSSSSLATQILEQGGADLFASADQANMKKVSDEDLVQGEPEVFARNRLAILVAPGNPKGIRELADLANPDLKVILAGTEVPVGRYAREALSKAGVTVRPVSEAVDVKGVVGPVTLGEADAGIVYATDVEAAGVEAAGVEIPDQHNVVAEYPVALIEGAPNSDVARAFLDLLVSDEGQAVLTEHGFIAP